MKMNVELDCTPEEMRRLLGLPDMADVNKAYMDSLTRTMEGAGSLDQLQSMMKSAAPMGEMGLRFFQSLMEAGAAAGKMPNKPA